MARSSSHFAKSTGVSLLSSSEQIFVPGGTGVVSCFFPRRPRPPVIQWVGSSRRRNGRSEVDEPLREVDWRSSSLLRRADLDVRGHSAAALLVVLRVGLVRGPEAADPVRGLARRRHGRRASADDVEPGSLTRDVSPIDLADLERDAAEAVLVFPWQWEMRFVLRHLSKKDDPSQRSGRGHRLRATRPDLRRP